MKIPDPASGFFPQNFCRAGFRINPAKIRHPGLSGKKKPGSGAGKNYFRY
jgi:hypothetical protein